MAFTTSRASQKFFGGAFAGLIGLPDVEGRSRGTPDEGNYEAAREAAEFYRDLFGKKILLEIQDQGLEMSTASTLTYFRLEKDLGLPMVRPTTALSLRRRRARTGCDAVHSNGEVDPGHEPMKFEGTQFTSRTATRCCACSRIRRRCSRAHLILRALQLRLERFPARFRTLMFPMVLLLQLFRAITGRDLRGGWKICAPRRQSGRLKHSLRNTRSGWLARSQSSADEVLGYF